MRLRSMRSRGLFPPPEAHCVTCRSCSLCVTGWRCTAMDSSVFRPGKSLVIPPARNSRMASPTASYTVLAQTSTSWTALEQMCRRDLPGALRQLAEHLEAGEISASLWNFQGNGMVQDWRREHFLMTLDLAARPVRPDEEPGRGTCLGKAASDSRQGK